MSLLGKPQSTVGASHMDPPLDLRDLAPPNQALQHFQRGLDTWAGLRAARDRKPSHNERVSEEIPPTALSSLGGHIPCAESEINPINDAPLG